jgi:hypothetical protein
VALNSVRRARSVSRAKYCFAIASGRRFYLMAISACDVARYQAGGAIDGVRLDQPAHLVIEARHRRVHVAKLATDQAKGCSEVFKIGRHSNSLRRNAAFEVVGTCRSLGASAPRPVRAGSRAPQINADVSQM